MWKQNFLPGIYYKFYVVTGISPCLRVSKKRLLNVCFEFAPVYSVLSLLTDTPDKYETRRYLAIFSDLWHDYIAFFHPSAICFVCVSGGGGGLKLTLCVGAIKGVTYYALARVHWNFSLHYTTFYFSDRCLHFSLELWKFWILQHRLTGTSTYTEDSKHIGEAMSGKVLVIQFKGWNQIMSCQLKK